MRAALRRGGGAPRSAAAWLLVAAALCYAAPLAHARGSAAAASSAGGAAAASSGPVSGGFTPLLDASDAAVAARSAAQSAAAAVLSDLTLRCADISIMQTGTDVRDAGDGYARLDLTRGDSLQQLMAAALATPVNSTFAVRPTELDGVNVWMLEYIASSTGIAFTYDLVFLPPALSGAARPTQLAYLFGTLGYDCLISATEVKAESLAVARFLLPNEQAGLSVVIPIGSLRDYTVLSVLFSWTNPFSWEIWVLVAASMFFASMCMYYFEGAERFDDYGAHDLHLVLRISRGAYKAFLNFACVGGFTPNTPASQTFNISFAFSMLLLQATYTANLAAYFTQQRQPSSPIVEVSSFASQQLTACVADTDAFTLLKSNFPFMRLSLQSGARTADLLDAVNAGTCAGAVASNRDLAFALGVQDSEGLYCNFNLVGGLLSQTYMGVPFSATSPRVTPAVFAALNSVAAAAYAYGDYATSASLASFPPGRAACGASSTEAPLSALTLKQVSGIFFVMVFGSIIAAGVWVFFHWKALQEAPPGGDAGGADAEPEGKEVHAQLVRKEEAIAAVCAALVREAAAALDVPPRTAAACERASRERAARLHVHLQLHDVDGYGYGPAVLVELPNAVDWQYLYTRMHPDEATLFSRTVRDMAAGRPDGVMVAPRDAPSGASTLMEQVVVKHRPQRGGGRGGRKPAAVSEEEAMPAKQQPQQPNAAFRFPSLRTHFSNLAGMMAPPQQSSPQPSQEPPPPRASERERSAPLRRTQSSGPPTRSDSELSLLLASRASRSARRPDAEAPDPSPRAPARRSATAGGSDGSAAPRSSARSAVSTRTAATAATGGAASQRPAVTSPRKGGTARIPSFDDEE